MYGFIYITTNLINGKKYLGQRKYDEGGYWNKYLGSGRLIIKAFEKYGKENFSKEIIAEAIDVDELNKLEEHYIKLHNCCYSNDWYNIRAGGSQTNPFEGMKEEEKQQWRDNLKEGTRKGYEDPFYCIDIYTGEKTIYNNRVDYPLRRNFIYNGTNELKLTKDKLLVKVDSYYEGIVLDALKQSKLLYLIDIETLEKEIHIDMSSIKSTDLKPYHSLHRKRILDKKYIVAYIKDCDNLDQIIKEYKQSERKFQLRNAIVLTDTETGKRRVFKTTADAAKILRTSSSRIAFCMKTNEIWHSKYLFSKYGA